MIHAGVDRILLQSAKKEIVAFASQLPPVFRGVSHNPSFGGETYSRRRRDKGLAHKGGQQALSESNTSLVAFGKSMVERFGVWNGQVYL